MILMDESYASEFEDLGYKITGHASAGPVSYRLGLTSFGGEDELVADIIQDTCDRNINIMCMNAARMNRRTADDRVLLVMHSGWLPDGSYFQITNMPSSSAPIAEIQPHEKWNEVDFWMGSRDLTAALFHLHKREIVHGAFSPWTVYHSVHGTMLADMWWAHNSEGSALYEDFTERYHDMLPVGCLPFLAPEVLEGASPTRQSDMFSLGAVLFYILTGTLPRQFTGELPENASKQEIRDAWARSPHTRARDYRPKLDAVIVGLVDMLMDPDPGVRLDPFELEDFIQGTLEKFAPA